MAPARAGSSLPPLSKKLGIKPDSRVALLSAPRGWNIHDLPQGVRLTTRKNGEPDVVLAFFYKRHRLESSISELSGLVFPYGMLWIAWPRKAAGHVSDIDGETIRELAIPTGLVDIKVAQIDEDWSGLKMVWRKELR